MSDEATLIEFNLFGQLQGYRAHMKLVTPAAKANHNIGLLMDLAKGLGFTPDASAPKADEPAKACPDCGEKMTYKSGTKDGRAWAGWFCPKRKRGTEGHVIWEM